MTHRCSWTLQRECSPDDWATLRTAVHALAHRGLPALCTALTQAPCPPGVWKWAWKRRQNVIAQANHPGFSADPSAWEDNERLVLYPAPALGRKGSNPREQPVRVYRLPHRGEVEWTDSLHGWAWVGALAQEANRNESPWRIIEASADTVTWVAVQKWAAEILCK